MPYEVTRSDRCPASRPWAVRKTTDGQVMGCHPSEQAARRQLAALYANEDATMSQPVKFVKGRDDLIEGLLAPYGGPEFLAGKDFDGEFFSPRTDFALDWFGDWQRPLLYQHGLDGNLKTSVVGRIAVKATDKGLWMQAQLDKAHEYAEEVAKLVQEKALGASSGSVSHLVERDQKSGEIKRWPLVEGSLTPIPANPLAQVGYPVKSADAIAHLAIVGTKPPDELATKADDAKAEGIGEAAEEKSRQGPMTITSVSTSDGMTLTVGLKEGRRNSGADLDRIQAMHDQAEAMHETAKALGATCPMDGEHDAATQDGETKGESVVGKPAQVLAITAGDHVEQPTKAELDSLGELLRPAIRAVIDDAIKSYFGS